MTERTAVPDILRIFAAVSVMLFHLCFWTWIPERGEPAELVVLAGGPDYLPDMGYWWGWIGVQVFFTLSGFLIAASAASSTWRSFVVSRARRLLPAAVVCALMTTALVATAAPLGEDWGPRLLRSVTLWPFGPWVDGVYWTLGMEMGFYALVAFLIASGRVYRLEAVMAGLAIVSAIAWVTALGQGLQQPRVAGLQDRLTQILLLKDAPFFAAGVILYLARTQGWSMTRMAMMLFVAIAGFAPIMAEAVVRGAVVESTFDYLLPVIIWLIGLALLATPLRIRSGPILSALSRATYPLYLLHNVGGTAIIVHMDRLGADRPVAIALAVAVSVVMALAVTLWVEPVTLRLAAVRFKHPEAV